MTIQATLERNDAESRIKLEARLDEAHRECAALRRRLQEEQDNFRSLSEHLEKKTGEAVKRMEEEREQAEKLRAELADARAELVEKEGRVEDLTKKLKGELNNYYSVYFLICSLHFYHLVQNIALFSPQFTGLIPTNADGAVDGRRLRQLEQLLADAQAEIQTLQVKLKTAKQAADQHCDVAEAAEKQLKEVCSF